MRVAVLGAGTMGSGMVRSLLRSGLEVTVWNRHPESVPPLEAQGARAAGTPAEAVADAEVVLTMLFDEDATAEIANDFLKAMPADAVWMQSATVGPDGAKRLAGLAERQGVAFADAPVVGTKKPAEDGTLTVLVSASETIVPRLAGITEAIGSKTVFVGAEPGGASGLKLACNAWIASLTAATAQSLEMCRALGVDPQLFLETIDGGPSDSPYAQLKGGLMLKDDFTPSFAVDGLLKDLRLMEASLGDSPASSGLLRSLERLFAAASDVGRGGDDVAAVVSALRP